MNRRRRFKAKRRRAKRRFGLLVRTQGMAGAMRLVETVATLLHAGTPRTKRSGHIGELLALTRQFKQASERPTVQS